MRSAASIILPKDGAKTDNGGQKTERTAYFVFYRGGIASSDYMPIIAPTKKLASSNAGEGWE